MTALIEWMANNRVAANLLMLLLLVGGLLSAQQTQQEVFPEFELEAVNVQVVYPGASPKEVEQGVLLAIEDAVSGLEQVDQVVAAADEGTGSVTVELINGADVETAVRDVQNAVDRVQTLPDDAEDPIITQVTRRSRVISVAITGDQALDDLQGLADQLKDTLTASPGVSLVEVSGVPEREVAIEVPAATLQAYGLTLDDVARQVRLYSLERPAGSVETRSGDIRVRVADRRLAEIDFGKIPVRSATAGSEVLLGDIATIESGYADDDSGLWLDGQRAVRVDAFRIGEERPSEVAAAVRLAVADLENVVPDTVTLQVLSDDSVVLSDRISLLLKNAFQGLILVLAVLALFLDLRTAIWVAAGIPISFLGAFLLLPALGVSINMISVFALLVVLGLVVDDAIVVGEQIFHEQETGEGSGTDRAVKGAKRMIAPVVVAVLTTIFAFAPMLGVPGMFGKIFSIFPLVVAAVLAFSAVEAFLILPAHLSHRGTSRYEWVTAGARARVTGALRGFIDRLYAPFLEVVLRWRGATAGAAIGLLAMSIGAVGGGWVPVSFFPDIAGNTVKATATLPAGVADAVVEETRLALEIAANTAVENTGSTDALDGLVTQRKRSKSGGEELVLELHFQEDGLVATPAEIEASWSEALPELPSIDSVVFSAATGPNAGAAIDVTLRHPDPAVLAVASAQLSATLESYADLTDVSTSLASSTEQLDVRVNPLGSSLGLTSDGLASQVRSAYQGAEALREQSGRHERTVRVRLPASERATEAELLELPVRVGASDYVALSQVAELDRSRAPARIDREDGARLVHVTAELAPGVVSSSDVVNELQESVLPDLALAHPGLSTGFDGQEAEMAESLSVLIPLGGVAMLAIFAMLAATFRSYVQPLVVMSAIPFGVIGAIGGHFLMGIPLTIISIFGIIALAGVVVNDSLVLVDAANERMQDGMPAHEAILDAGRRRFRPILLTSLTTFLGLAPMLLETSVQAQFLIPMAVSLGFGILFATVIVLVLVPAFFLLVEDLRGWLGRGETHEVLAAEPLPAK